MEEKPKSISRNALIKEISHVTQLKPEIVASVLNAFTDIFIREVVLRGVFTFTNCFKVRTHVRRKRKQYNVSKKMMMEYPETKVLSIALSGKINSFYRWKQRNEFNNKNGITIEDWQKRIDSDIPE